MLSDEILFQFVQEMPEERANVAMMEYFGATSKNMPQIYIKQDVVAYKFDGDVRTMTVEQLTDFI